MVSFGWLLGSIIPVAIGLVMVARLRGSFRKANEAWMPAEPDRHVEDAIDEMRPGDPRLN